MRRDLDLTILRAFLAVVETGSVTGAARLLNRTQAAVSLQIKRLEDTLGQPLFERGHKRLSLAPSGEQLIGFAQRLVAMNDEVVETMTTPSFEGEVRLGLPVDLIVTYAAPILRRFNTKWPGVRVSLIASNSQELVEELERGRVDLALTTDLEPPGRHVETMTGDDLVWVGAPGGSAHRRTPLPIAIGGRSCRFRPVLLDTLRRTDIEWRVVLEVANQDAVNATVAAGISVAVMLRETVPVSLEVITGDSGLPALPSFALNLRLPPAGTNELAEEMARHIRAEFAARASLRGERFFHGPGDRRARRSGRAAA
ncbi:MAG: LysR family transcriptional regulator [Hyphomicrobiaceae bacterium]